jgi:hypothetical protein
MKSTSDAVACGGTARRQNSLGSSVKNPAYQSGGTFSALLTMPSVQVSGAVVGRG